MSLTMGGGPLSEKVSGSSNYAIDGPGHRLLLEPFPRRVRAVFAGQVVIDTLRGALLHETGELPQLYVPQTDVSGHLLRPSDTSEEDVPGLGLRRYSDLAVGDREAHDAVWSHPDPPRETWWLRGLNGVAFEAMDTWFDEDEEVLGRLRDPYHRVDIRRTARRIRVSCGSTVLAESERPVMLSETGMPSRFYIPPDDVRAENLTRSDTRSVCAYKGEADYCDAAGEHDIGWRYVAPEPEASPIAGHWCFDDTRARIEVDSRPPANHGRRRTTNPQFP